MRDLAGLRNLPFHEMVDRSLPNLNRTFFLVYDNRENQMKPWLVWAADRASAVECVGSYERWEATRRNARDVVSQSPSTI